MAQRAQQDLGDADPGHVILCEGGDIAGTITTHDRLPELTDGVRLEAVSHFTLGSIIYVVPLIFVGTRLLQGSPGS